MKFIFVPIKPEAVAFSYGIGRSRARSPTPTGFRAAASPERPTLEQKMEKKWKKEMRKMAFVPKPNGSPWLNGPRADGWTNVDVECPRFTKIKEGYDMSAHFLRSAPPSAVYNRLRSVNQPVNIIGLSPMVLTSKVEFAKPMAAKAQRTTNEGFTVVGKGRPCTWKLENELKKKPKLQAPIGYSPPKKAKKPKIILPGQGPTIKAGLASSADECFPTANLSKKNEDLKNHKEAPPKPLCYGRVFENSSSFKEEKNWQQFIKEKFSTNVEKSESNVTIAKNAVETYASVLAKFPKIIAKMEKNAMLPPNNSSKENHVTITRNEPRLRTYADCIFGVKKQSLLKPQNGYVVLKKRTQCLSTEISQQKNKGILVPSIVFYDIKIQKKNKNKEKLGREQKKNQHIIMPKNDLFTPNNNKYCIFDNFEIEQNFGCQRGGGTQNNSSILGSEKRQNDNAFTPKRSRSSLPIIKNSSSFESRIESKLCSANLIESDDFDGEPRTGEEGFTNPTQEFLNDRGISTKENLRLMNVKRSLGGTFTTINCVFCNLPVNENQGHATLTCGHKAHWEQQYYEWLSFGPWRCCPKCKKQSRSKCIDCNNMMGAGYHETECYCSGDTLKSKRHADELEKILQNNNGKCHVSGCTSNHPGFCVLCKTLFKLNSNGDCDNKVYLQCCDTYLHSICWNNNQSNGICPYYCGNEWKGIINITARKLCGVKNVLFQQNNQIRPRGCLGGRSRSDAQATTPKSTLSKSAQASLDAILMPPPSSLAPRRSTRDRRPLSTSSILSLPTTPLFTPVTTQCASMHTTHIGLGCAARSANHLPQYYDTLDKDTSNCPHCDALLFFGEASGHAAFSKCCAKGRVDLAARFKAMQQQPEHLQILFNNKEPATLRLQRHLMDHVLTYNNNISFGHIQTQRSEEEIFRIVKCNNMIQYILWDYNPPDGSLPLLHGQLFTIPADNAKERIGEIAEQLDLDADLMILLHQMLRKYHPMAKLYETAAETYQQLPADEQVNMRMLVVGTNKQGQERTMKEDEAPPVDVQLPSNSVLKQIHPGRLQVETEAGSHLVAQFYVDSGQNVIPSMEYEVVLMGRKGSGKQHMKWWHREIDPALFPLLFPRGQHGYEDGLPLKLKEGEHLDKCLKNIKQKNNKPLDEKEELGEEEEFLGEMERQFKQRDHISRAQFFRYMAQIRGKNWREQHWLWQWGELAQLYTITANNRMEAERVQYMKRLIGNRKLITPASIMNMLEKYRDGQGLTGEIGRVYMTDEHFRGSRQFYQKEYANCMTMCREIGKPDLLVTFTMDPECQELDTLLPYNSNGKRQPWYDRADIITRLFIDKLKELERDLTERMVMGPLKGWFYSVEHQKRGMPHVHICLILDWETMRVGGKIRTPEDYIDEYICAEIPLKPEGRTKYAILQRHLYNTVTTKNIHTCSAKRCLVDGKCIKHFPKPYEYDNIYSENAYPRYRRRPPPPTFMDAQQYPEQYGRVFEYIDRRANTIRKDNAYVVAYNPFLSAKYRSHINVEFIAGDGCIKYLCKYVMKGADMAFIKISGQEGKLAYDEYHQLRLARYITSMEAAMSMWGTPLVRRSHIVDELDVHGPEGHRIAVEQGFNDEEEKQSALLEAAEKEEERRKTGEERVTQLTAYFAYNKQRSASDGPLHLTYANAYKKLRYDKVNRRWQPYVIGGFEGKKLCRLKTVSPAQMELLAIRLLLLVVEDPTSWEDLRRYNGTVQRTFVKAAQARGLLSDNELWMRTIREAFATKKTTKQCIRWLAVFFATANLSKPTDLFNYVMEISKTWLAVPSLSNASPETKRQYVLRALEWFLLANGVHPDSDQREDGTFETACEKIGLPRPDGVNLTQNDYLQLVFFRDDLVNARLPEELQTNMPNNSMRKRYEAIYAADPKPNNEQQKLVDAVFDGVMAAKELRKGFVGDQTVGIPKLFMVTGEGGAGKTFTYNKIIAKVKAAGFNFLPMATTGIAAELLYEGQTVHKRLCRQRHIDASTPLNVDLESNFAEMLRRIDGMIIDEISMQNRDVLEYVDRLLKTVVRSAFLKNLPFGGKAVVIGGDWKQLTPVVPGGGHLDQFNASVKNSTLFQHFTTYRLVTNHRLQPGQQQYRNFLKRVGTGLINDIQQRVKLPKQMVEPDREALLQFVFPQELLDKPLDNWQALSERAILCPLNKETFQLNNILMDQMTTKEHNYTAITMPIVDDADALQMENIAAEINQENLTRLTPPGIPEHHLRVKVGAVMMVTNNISVEEGLCNGTRVQVLELFNNIVRCKILTGTHKGDEHDLHKARFQFGGDPKALHEGPIRCERIQFPLRPGSVMTINKSQGQTLSHVGVLLDKSQCFSHGQLYTALSRVREDSNIRVCTKNTGRRIKNIIMLELLDKEDMDAAPLDPPDDPNDPYPRGPPPDNDSDNDDNDQGPPKPPSPAFKTPTTSARRPSSPEELLSDGITLHNLKKIKIVKGDITKQCVFMIINDEKGETNNSICRECEPNYAELRHHLRQIQDNIGGNVPDGFVAITPTFGKLSEKAKYIAHVAAPNCKGRVATADDLQNLQLCYTKSLQELINEIKKQGDQKPQSIAFPPIATGECGLSRDVAAKAAFDALLKWLAQNPADSQNIEEIRLVPFSRPDERLYKIQWQRIKRKLNEQKRSKGSRTSSTASSLRSLSPVSSDVVTTPPVPAELSDERLSTAIIKKAKKYLATSNEKEAFLSPPVPKQQLMNDDTTSKIDGQIPDTATAKKAFLRPAAPDGNCYFNAVCWTLFGGQQHAAQLRKRMFALLRTIVADQHLFLRKNPNYNNRDDFIHRLDGMLVTGNDEGITSLSEYAARREQDGNWAQLNDSMLLAILLNRPVVIVLPNMSQQEIERLRPLWNDERQQLLVYFPDGEMRQQARRSVPLDQLQNFTMVQEFGEHVDTRRVNNAIVIHYNGINHFDSINFAPQSAMAGNVSDVIFNDNYVPDALRPPAQGLSPATEQPITSGQQPSEVKKEPTPTKAEKQPRQPSTAESSIKIIRKGQKIEIHGKNKDMVMKKVAKRMVNNNSRLMDLMKRECEEKQQLLFEKKNSQWKMDIKKSMFKTKAQLEVEKLEKEVNTASEQYQWYRAETMRLNEYIKAAVDADFRVEQQNGIIDTIRATAVGSDPQAVPLFFDRLRGPLEELYNAIRNHLLLWHALRQVDPETASEESLNKWLEEFEFCRQHFSQLGDTWMEAEEKYESNFRKIYKACQHYNNPNYGSDSPVSSALKYSLKLIRGKKEVKQERLDAMLAELSHALTDKKKDVIMALKKKQSIGKKTTALRRRQLDEPTRRRTSASPSKIRAIDAAVDRSRRAAAAESRFATLTKRTPAEQAHLQQEMLELARREEAESKLSAKLTKVEAKLDAHIQQLQNVVVRNLQWDREAAMEQRIRQRYYEFRSSITEQFQSAIDSGAVITDFEQYLSSEAAIRALCDEIIEVAKQDTNADINDLMAKHQDVIEREERALAEQQHWRNLVYQSPENQSSERPEPMMSGTGWGIEDEIRLLNLEQEEIEQQLEKERLISQQHLAENAEWISENCWQLEEEMHRIHLNQSQQHLAEDTTKKRTRHQAQIRSSAKNAAPKNATINNGIDGVGRRGINGHAQQQEAVNQLYFSEAAWPTEEPGQNAPGSPEWLDDQSINFIQPDPEAIMAREIINQRLNIEEADYVEESCGSDDKDTY